MFTPGSEVVFSEDVKLSIFLDCAIKDKHNRFTFVEKWKVTLFGDGIFRCSFLI